MRCLFFMLSFKDELPDQEKQVFLLKPFYLGILTNSLKVSAALSIQSREVGVTRKLLVYSMCLCSFQVASYRSYCLVPWDTTLSGILQERSPTGMKGRLHRVFIERGDFNSGGYTHRLFQPHTLEKSCQQTPLNTAVPFPHTLPISTKILRARC